METTAFWFSLRYSWCLVGSDATVKYRLSFKSTASGYREGQQSRSWGILDEAIAIQNAVCKIWLKTFGLNYTKKYFKNKSHDYSNLYVELTSAKIDEKRQTAATILEVTKKNKKRKNGKKYLMAKSAFI